MLARQALVVLSLWLVAGSAAAAEREVLIWGGSAKPEEELTLYHLTTAGPADVLSFEYFTTKSDVECTATTEATYAAVEDSLHEGYYPIHVETTASDGGCAKIYWDRAEGEPPGDLGTTREEKTYRWGGSTYR